MREHARAAIRVLSAFRIDRAEHVIDCVELTRDDRLNANCNRAPRLLTRLMGGRRSYRRQLR
jgi:hypothetical protein